MFMSVTYDHENRFICTFMYGYVGPICMKQYFENCLEVVCMYHCLNMVSMDCFNTIVHVLVCKRLFIYIVFSEIRISNFRRQYISWTRTRGI